MSKRIITALLAVIMLLGMFSTTAFAASTEEEALGEVDIYNGGSKYSYLAMNGKIQTFVYTYFYYESPITGAVKEIPAYCVNPTVKGVPQTVAEGESIKYLADEKASDPKLTGIVASGYPTRGLAELGLENKAQAYYATKFALWCYIIPGWDINKATVNPNLTGLELERAQKMLAAAKDIYRRGSWWTNNPSPSLTTLADREEAYPVTINGKQYKQQVFTVNSETWICDYTVNVSFADPDSVPEGTRIVDMNNRDITKITTTTEGGEYAGKFKVLYPVESIEGQSGSIQLNLDADVYQYAVFYATCAEVDEYGNLQNYMCDTDPTRTMEVAAMSSYGDDPPVEIETGLEIMKVSAGDEVPLSGAVFEIIGPDGDVFGSYSTDSSGRILVELTMSGTYTVTEKIPPRFYLPAEEPTQTVTVSYGEVAKVTFANEPYGSLRVEKVDSITGAGLYGAQVRIKHIESGEIRTGQTNMAGVCQFNQIRTGAWEILEQAAPMGYQIDSAIHTVNVTPGDPVSYTLKNTANPGLRIIKYDRKNMVVLPDVTFEIFRDGVSLGRFKTDEQGEILLVDQEPGTFRAVEVDTGNEALILDSTPQEIELKAGDGIRELYFFNDTKPGMWLIKVDSADPSKVIPNAVFEIKAVDGSFGPKEYTTSQSGEIDLSALPEGSYVVTEKSCEGYVIDDAQRIVHLTANETGRFVFTNSVKPSLRLTKLSSDKTPLEGVTYRLAKIEDGSRYLDRTTSPTGEIVWEGLEPGVYSLLELDTRSDHIRDPKEYHIELYPGKVSTIVLENSRRPSLVIHKNDSDSGAPVEGAVYLVKSADGHSLAEVKTGPDGTATVEGLLPQVVEVIEKSVPEPYLLDAPSQLVTLLPDQERHVYFENHKAPTIVIEKVDSITKNPISDVRFQVWYASNNTATGELNDLGVFTTDENGRIELSGPEHGLRDGWFRVKELSPPTGYSIADSDTQEDFVAAGKSKTFRFENTPLSALVVWKRDSVSGEGLSNCRFQLRYLGGSTSGSGGTVIGTYVTSDNGSFTVTGLKAGYYICEEVESDGAHVIDSAPQSFYISGKEQDVITLYFSNAPLGSLLVTKKSSADDTPLADVEFLVTTSDGTVVGNANGRYVTDSTGSFLVENIIPNTTLVVKEVKGLENFVMDDTPQSAVIRSGQTVTLEFLNAPYGSLLIRKLGVDNTPLSDVEFTITTSDGTAIGPSGGKYVTDSAGTILIEGLEPGLTVIAKETRTKPGYVLDSVAQTAVIKSGATSVLEFRNSIKGNLIIYKLSSSDRSPLEGVEFEIRYADGSYVDNEGGALSSRGRYFTSSTGQIVLSGVVGTLVVTEVASIDGYTIDEATRSQTVVVNTNDTQVLYFYNDPMGGVEIIKISEADRTERIPNTTFEIRQMNDALVDTVTTDRSGRAFVSLPDGAYYAVEIEAGDGFRLDSTPHHFEVKDGEITQLRVTNKPFSGILIHKVDSTTGKGIYGIRFLLYDENRNPLGEYVSDQNGRVYIDDLPGGGKYFLRELEAEGYELDTQLKTVYVEDGATTEITWKNTPITGQIQIIKYASDDNAVTGDRAGSTLEGAVFEITRARSGVVVGYIVSDARGVAASEPLPLGRYKIREVTPPSYFQLSGEVFDVDLEYAGQIIKLSAYNKSAELKVSITKTGNAQVLSGDLMRYDFKISNDANVPLSDFYWHDRLPTDAVRGNTLVTGTYSQRLNYRIVYKTNYQDYRVLAENLLTTNNYSFSLNALPMMSGEYVTDFRFEFGTVEAGFTSVSTPMLTVNVLPTTPNQYQIVNRADVGGRYQGVWETAKSTWITIVKSKTPAPQLPKTGC